MPHRRRAPISRPLGVALAALLVIPGCSSSSPPDTSPASAPTSPAPSVVANAPTPVWRSVASVPTARQEVAAAALDGRVWVMGGLGEQGSTAAVEAYDPTVDRWTIEARLPVPLHHPMAASYRGEVVVMGGFSPDEANLYGNASDRVLALRGGTWVELPPLRRPRGAGAAAVVGDQIVVVGGLAGGALVGPSEVFDGTRWRDVAAIPTPRDHLAAATDGQVLYAVGGRALRSADNSAAVERYDPANDRWEAVADLPSPQGGLGAAMVGGRLVALGGEKPSGNLPQVGVFDPNPGTWAQLPPMPTPRHGIGVAVVDGTLYALVGGLQPGVAPSDAAEALSGGIP